MHKSTIHSLKKHNTGGAAELCKELVEQTKVLVGKFYPHYFIWYKMPCYVAPGRSQPKRDRVASIPFLHTALLIQLTVGLTVEKSNGGQWRFAVCQQGGYADL